MYRMYYEIMNNTILQVEKSNKNFRSVERMNVNVEIFKIHTQTWNVVISSKIGNSINLTS